MMHAAISRGSPAPDPGAPVRVVIVTLDRHLSGVFKRAASDLSREIPGLSLALHAATDWAGNPDALDRCLADIAGGDIIVATMLFMEDHVRAVLPALEARRESCDAMIGALSAGEVIRLTKLGPFRMDGSDKGPLALLKRLRGSKVKSSGAGQMAMLRRLPKILRFIPGAAQDLRAYFLTMQYWLSGSQDNLVAMLSFLVGRYADGPRQALRGRVVGAPPKDYPEVGLYHPRAAGRIVEQLDALPPPAGDPVGVVGLLVLRSYVLADDAGHYDGVIAALEARGLRVVPAFASGLDARPAIERFFMQDGRSTVDTVVSLSGFSLVGGPAYNDAKAAEEILARLGVPYISAEPLEFQTLEAWGASSAGLSPVESTIMVAIPELDGAISPMVFGGRSTGDGSSCQGCARRCRFPVSAEAPLMQACPERAETLAARVLRLVTLRRTARKDRKLAIVLFNFPPNSGAVGSAAYLSVFASLHNVLKSLQAGGYDVEAPASVDELRTRLIAGNSAQFGADANVHRRIPVDDHVRRERHLAEIEGQWGPAPGKALSDGRSIFVLGAEFGNVFVGLQPGFGYEGDPMRLLFERGFAPTHAFSAFYRYLREDFGANAVLHFGTHGALEFMPGKQVGLSADCWPDRLIGDLPNVYLYAANNPSEGALAKRRSGATLVSYLTPPIAQAGLYRGLLDLKASIQRWRTLGPDANGERGALEGLIREQAQALEIPAAQDGAIAAIADQVFEVEQTLIPSGLHTVGEPATPDERLELMVAMSQARGGPAPAREALMALVAGAAPQTAILLSGLNASSANIALLSGLAASDRLLARDHEVDAILHALDGGYIRPAPGGDLLRTPEILPTGRNLHGFDPFHIPSAFALREGAHQAQIILDRHQSETGAFPESIALVLWGSDNLKSEGGPIGQALMLMGARPRFDSYGRLCGAALIPLEELGRPRVDVVMTLSGIFRDLLALQVRMLAEAAYLAAAADEPLEMNFVRKHALDHQREQGCDLETAALRVFSNADGAYGANVNQLIDAGCWTDEDELADAYQARKCFAYGRTGAPMRQSAMLQNILKRVDLAYQNVESVELGVTTIDHYVDTLGGISRAVRRARGVEMPVYIGDQTQGEAKVRTLAEQVALETRTRMLNPRWYEGLLQHGYEGVRQIEAQVTNTMGWSATTGQVAPWIYQQITETYVLDPAMRERLAALNPTSSSRMAKRLLEACDRQYWAPDDATLEALRRASDDLEDRLEGVPTAA
ncbi:magnesium chelatase subunit H [Phenylobacterium sp.]|uniref:magnesium chelatase subunit H n=1 Tax=Phenylobacterium sp. TaxID=1871053 RepID=UPI0025ED1D76|nr:magnesium chelatase subunit H [Phenylobacterium sp.]